MPRAYPPEFRTRAIALVRAGKPQKAADHRGRCPAAPHRGAAAGEVGHTSRGRRIHDLRHTAACLWLALGVDPGTVQAWMGHESIATTNRYLHFLGTSADQAGLDRLNDPSRGVSRDPDRGRQPASAGPGVPRG